MCGRLFEFQSALDRFKVVLFVGRLERKKRLQDFLFQLTEK